MKLIIFLAVSFLPTLSFSQTLSTKVLSDTSRAHNKRIISQETRIKKVEDSFKLYKTFPSNDFLVDKKTNIISIPELKKHNDELKKLNSKIETLTALVNKLQASLKVAKKKK